MVRLVTALWKPGALAVRMTTPALTPVRAKVAVVPFCAMVTVAGETVATVVSLLPSVTVTSAAEAGPSSVTVALKLRPAPSKGPGVVTVMVRKLTFTVAVPLVKPVAEAVMVALPAVVPAVIWKVMVVAPCGTVTLLGTETTAVLLLESETTSPLEGAALPMVIVMVPVFVAGRFRELGVRTMLFAAGAIVTV